jgi:predicted O-methyltransferase YrrM
MTNGIQTTMKLLRLLSLLPTRSQEFYDHGYAIATSRWEASFGAAAEYRAMGLEEASLALSGALHSNCAAHLLEPELTEIELHVRERQTVLLMHGPFAAFHNGDATLARLCYAVTRALQPEVAFETGVCYGVTSAFLLQGMKTNEKGHLHSIDLPPLGKDADAYVGWLVPADLRRRWTLHRGTSGRLLKPLLSGRGAIDLFVHDSLHTYANMAREFGIAWAALRAGGVLFSDDVDGNSAFLELSKRPDVACSLVVKEHSKKALLGIAVKR